MKTYIIPGLLAVASTLAFTGCDDVFEPAPENNLPLGYIEENATYAENMLGAAYLYLPNRNGFPYSEAATDDAVSNDFSNSYRIMASGRWTSQNNPINRWDVCRSAIQYCNLLLENVDRVTFAKDELVNELFTKRFAAEARALRAIHTYYLLQSHAGYDNAGNLLGVPIVNEAQTLDSYFNVPRDTYVDCLKAIKEDIDAAMEVLPWKYGESCFPEMRLRYPGITDGQLKRVFGDSGYGRVCGLILQGFIGRLALMSASPAFEASGCTWAQAADENARMLDEIGCIAGLDPKGGSWYCDGGIQNLKDYEAPAEIIWRSEKKSNDSSIEKENFPPTLYGNGRVNPTQNLVDAFPMLNGYPITDPKGNYSASAPYADRDPRLAMYILYDGATAGHNNRTIHTSADAPDNDGLEKISTSTRTGYYMKKHLRQDVNCDPSSTTGQTHYQAYMRYTEFFLNYAEAANEAWGPTNGSTHGYSAYDIIKAIRKRAGIGTDNGDEYLESIKNDKDEMRRLIHNERRIELCFEGFRLYDLFRWKNRWGEDLNTPAMGMNITGVTHTPFMVEERKYSTEMYYGPIPYTEVLKYSALVQNAGW